MISDLADVPARWSWLYHMTSSPLHAREAALHGKEPTASMKLGTAGHVVTFEQPYAVWPQRRQGKAWEEFKASCVSEGKEPIGTKDYDKACRIRDALRGHPDAAELLFGTGVVREQTILWSRNGRACSSRPDARKPGVNITDLKVVRTAKPHRFTTAAKWAGYPGQLAYYREADNFETGYSVGGAELYIVAVEPFAPYAVTPFRLMPSAVAYGDGLIEKCWSRLVECEAANEWPGYSQSVVDFDVDDDVPAGPDFDEIDPSDATYTDDNEGDL